MSKKTDVLTILKEGYVDLITRDLLENISNDNKTILKTIHKDINKMVSDSDIEDIMNKVDQNESERYVKPRTINDEIKDFNDRINSRINRYYSEFDDFDSILMKRTIDCGHSMKFPIFKNCLYDNFNGVRERVIEINEDISITNELKSMMNFKDYSFTEELAYHNSQMIKNEITDKIINLIHNEAKSSFIPLKIGFKKTILNEYRDLTIDTKKELIYITNEYLSEDKKEYLKKLGLGYKYIDYTSPQEEVRGYIIEENSIGFITISDIKNEIQYNMKENNYELNSRLHFGIGVVSENPFTKIYK